MQNLIIPIYTPVYPVSIAAKKWHISVYRQWGRSPMMARYTRFPVPTLTEWRCSSGDIGIFLHHLNSPWPSSIVRDSLIIILLENDLDYLGFLIEPRFITLP